MSKCMTCKYALYDGMCLAQGKFTLLDASACDDYKPRIDVEVSKLKAENSKLRSLVRELWEGYNDPRCGDCPLNDKPACIDCPICAREEAVIDRMRELGVVDE